METSNCCLPRVRNLSSLEEMDLLLYMTLEVFR